MIYKTIAFGVPLTDEAGQPLDGKAPLIAAIKAGGFESVLATCPTAKKDQLVFGYACSMSKRADFTRYLMRWDVLVSSLPKDIQAVAKSLSLPEPDIHFMAGSRVGALPSASEMRQRKRERWAKRGKISKLGVKSALAHSTESMPCPPQKSSPP